MYFLKVRMKSYNTLCSSLVFRCVMFFGQANQVILPPLASASDELNPQPTSTPIFSPLQNIIAYASISENPLSEVGVWGGQAAPLVIPPPWRH